MQQTYATLTEALAATRPLGDRGITFIAGTGNEVFLAYPQLYRQALRYLGYLQRKGVRAGNELVLQIEDNEQFLLAFWACVLGGIRAVPLAVTHHGENSRKLFRIWDLLDQPYLLTTGRTFGQLEKEAGKTGNPPAGVFAPDRALFLEEMQLFGEAGECYPARPADIAFIQFSSGSTGNPKGVVLTHANLLANISDSLGTSGCSAADTHLSWMPLTHDMGLIGFHLNPLVLGVNHFIMPTDLFIRRPALWLHKLAEHRITVTSSPNFGYRHLLNQWKPAAAGDLDLSGVRLIFNGAEPISADLCRLFLETAAPYGLRPTVMFTVYGLAEATLAVSFPPPGEPFSTLKVSRRAVGVGQPVVVDDSGEDAAELVNLGKAIPRCALRIAAEDGRELPEGVVGYVRIRGENVTAGYYNNPEATRQAIRDGWLDTGDLGFLREGQLFITGRAKDVIFVNGQNVYAHDVERVAEALEGVEMGKIAACGVPDLRTNAEQLVLFVVSRQTPTQFYPLARQVKATIARRLGLEAAQVIPVRNLPKTTSGKVKRFVLVEQYRNGLYDEVIRQLAALPGEEPVTAPAPSALAPDGPRTAAAIRQWMVQWLAKRLSLPEAQIHPNQSFADHGVTSLVAVELAQALSRFLGYEVDTTVAWSFPDIGSLAGYLARQPAPADGPVPAAARPLAVPVAAEPAGDPAPDDLTEMEWAQLLAEEIKKN